MNNKIIIDEDFLNNHGYYSNDDYYKSMSLLIGASKEFTALSKIIINTKPNIHERQWYNTMIDVCNNVMNEYANSETDEDITKAITRMFSFFNNIADVIRLRSSENTKK